MRTLRMMPVWLKVMGKRIMVVPIMEFEMATAVLIADLLMEQKIKIRVLI